MNGGDRCLGVKLLINDPSVGGLGQPLNQQTCMFNIALDHPMIEKVTNKDILRFGEDINIRVDTILEKRLQKAITMTKKFKVKEENKERSKIRKKTKKENKKALAKIKSDLKREDTIVSRYCRLFD